MKTDIATIENSMAASNNQGKFGNDLKQKPACPKCKDRDVKRYPLLYMWFRRTLCERRWESDEDSF